MCSKQSNFFSFYALPSGGESKDAVVYCDVKKMKINQKEAALRPHFNGGVLFLFKNIWKLVRKNLHF